MPIVLKNVKLKDIQKEFGGPGNDLRDYVRGGEFVTLNDYAPNVPTDKNQLDFHQFYCSKKNKFNTLKITSSTIWKAPYSLVGTINMCIIGGGGGSGQGGRYFKIMKYQNVFPNAGYRILIGAGGASSIPESHVTGTRGGHTIFDFSYFGLGGEPDVKDPTKFPSVVDEITGETFGGHGDVIESFYGAGGVGLNANGNAGICIIQGWW